MGYWNQDTEGHSLLPEPTGLVWGDAPADVMAGAVDDIVQAFQADLGRRPTQTEIIAGLKFHLGGRDELAQ